MAIIAKEDAVDKKPYFLTVTVSLMWTRDISAVQSRSSGFPAPKRPWSRLHKLGYAVFVVTNQSGIARGYYTVEDMKVLHAFMAKEIEKAGGQITHFYYCPHHPTKGTVKELVHPCSCRKPQPDDPAGFF